jgi:predicted DNA-binding antitoxin AbrB/MazE fold protein
LRRSGRSCETAASPADKPLDFRSFAGILLIVKTIHAVFEGGMFRPLETVELPERCEVEFEPRPIKPSEDVGENLSAIYAILSERYASGEHDVAARHNEHQP